MGAAAALAAISVSAAVLSYGYHSATRWLYHSRDVARVARELRSRTLEWDGRVRAFRVSGNARLLESAAGRRAAALSDLDSLRQLTLDNPQQQANAEALRSIMYRWDAAFTAPDILAAQGSSTASEAIAMQDGLLDSVQIAQERFIAAEDALFARRLARVERWQRNTVITVFAAVILVALALMTLRRRLLAEAQLQAAQQSRLEEQAVQLELQTSALEFSNHDLQQALEEAKEARYTVEASMEEQRALLRAISDVIAVMDRNGTYLRLEAKETGNTTRAPQHLIGMNIRDTLKPDVVANMLSVFEKAIVQQVPVPYEYEIDSGGHTLTFEAVASPLGGDRLLCVARNVTEQRRSDVQLRQAQKMEAVGRLAGGVAHDFNNMLAVIMSYGNMLAEELGKDSAHYADVQEINGAAERAASLTRQLLAFSRKQMLRPTVLDLNESISELEKMLRRLTNADIDFNIRLDAKAGFIRADRGQIDQVFVNLIVNASDAMPDGGMLTIETRNADLDIHAARLLGISEAGTYVMLTVRDTGIGMNAETVAQIFEPFFTTKQVGRGTGLGLSTVYGIVKQSGGHVVVNSELGEGTSFIIFLPRLEETGTRMPTQHMPTPMPRGTGSILLVEDEDAVRRVTLRALERAGYSVIEARDGREAVALLDRLQAPVDLVITDMLMPGIGGLELAQTLWQRTKETRVLFMSGYSKEQIVPDDLMRSGVAFMPKPFTSIELLGRVNELLTGEVSPEANYDS